MLRHGTAPDAWTSYTRGRNRDRNYADVVRIDGQIVVHPIEEAAVQRAIMAGGPVAASMQVLADFPTYRSGVYSPKSSDVLRRPSCRKHPRRGRAGV